MTLQEVLQHFDGIKQQSDGKYMARCPAHDDRKQSLSIGQGEKGVVLKCHAGCDTRVILEKAGLKQSDLFDKPQERPQIVAIYDYKDENGKVIAQKIRRSDKSFIWRKPNGTNGWIYNRQGIPDRLYVAGSIDGVVCVCEGEKDADNLHKLGMDAVSGADGAGPGKWKPEYTEQLREQSVLIFSDNDKPGQDFAQETAAALHGIAASVQVFDLKTVWPEIPNKGDVSDLLVNFGIDKATQIIANLIATTPQWEPNVTQVDDLEQTDGRKAKPASIFGENRTSFLWYPFLPIGDYTVMMADGGTGKTVLCCGIAAAISNGQPLPGEVYGADRKNVLIISAEDSGEVLKERLKLSGADLDKVYVLDRSDSIWMNFSDEYSEFEATVKRYKPTLVIIDPWHGFLGESVDINRVNAIRPVFQKLANLARECDCALILVSHVNKRAQGENANNAATGSTDFINASRSAVRVIFDETDDDCRIMVHTKTNYAAYGRSIKYRIIDGGVQWAGYSEITKQTLETAARRRDTPWEVIQKTEENESVNAWLVETLNKSANEFKPTRFLYDEYRKVYGDMVFGGLQPKRALDAVKDRLNEDGFFLKTGIQVKKGGIKGNGFMIQAINASEPEQLNL